MPPTYRLRAVRRVGATATHELDATLPSLDEAVETMTIVQAIGWDWVRLTPVPPPGEGATP